MRPDLLVLRPKLHPEIVKNDVFSITVGPKVGVCATFTAAELCKTIQSSQNYVHVDPNSNLRACVV